MKYIVLIVIALLSIGAGVLFFFTSDYQTETDPTDETTPVSDQNDTDATGDGDEAVSEEEGEDETDTEDTDAARPAQQVIGSSAGGHDITVHHFGNGDETVLFVGGIHGGYSYNSSLVTYELIEYLEANPAVVPDNLTIAVIPQLNADGFAATVGAPGVFTASAMPTPLDARIPSRFNDNDVDLNRNFACNWQAEATWRDQTVSAGSSAFSETETQAIRDYADTYNIRAAVAYFSAEGGVYGSTCDGNTPAMTSDLVDTYASASGYPGAAEFDAYTITGDMMDWFASQNVPAISILLSNHTNTEWEQNRAGIETILNHLDQ